MTAEELRREQAHVDLAYARLEVLRQRARALAEGVLDRGFISTHQARYERDVMVHTSGVRLAQLELGTLPLVFGRVDYEDGSPYHIGRVAVPDADRTPLVVDWRAPVAEPFYRATPSAPLGLVRRRHFRTHGQRLLGLDDELLAEDGGALTLVGEAALLAAVDRARTDRMGDIVATIQAEQDAIIRAPLRGVLVVQGAPGTGKTAVALHRAAYLLYTHRRVLANRGLLLIGPTGAFLRYIEDVLPSLGEHGVRMATMASLLPDYKATAAEPAAVARLKGDPRMAEVLARAHAERTPAHTLLALLTSAERIAAAADGVLSRAEQATLEQRGWRGWTSADLPLLDELTALRPPTRRRPVLDDEERWQLERVVDDLTAAQPIDAAMAEDLLARLSESRLDLADAEDEEAPTYGHAVVDEAQDLSPMQWRMLRRRCPSGSLTVVGDLAQATGVWVHERWDDAVASLARRVTVAELTINYRTPAEIMSFADRVRPRSLPPAQPVRSTGIPPVLRHVPEPERLGPAVATAVEEALGAVEGTVGVVVPSTWGAGLPPRDERVTAATVEVLRGMEFDAVIVVEPAAIVEELNLRALYVALTRPTQLLIVLHARCLPRELVDEHRPA